MTSISKIANYLINNAESLAIEIVEDVIRRMKLEIPDFEKEQAIKMYIEFIGFLGRTGLVEKEAVPEYLIVWSKKNGEREASSDGRISEIIVRYSTTRDIFTELITSLSLEYDLSIKETADTIKRINSILDISINETLFAFERLSNKIIEDKSREIVELSAPIVPIKENMAVLPLIGSIDSYRASYLLEQVVPKIVQQNIKHLIVDFSGILNIDIEITEYLYKIENVLRLLGIQTIVTGLSPKLAQTIIIAGIDMSEIKTYAHVKQALESLT